MAGPWVDGKGTRFHLKVEAHQRFDDSECRTRYWKRLRTRDHPLQQQQEEEEEVGKEEEEVEIDGLQCLIRIRMVKERQEPGANMDGVNDSDHSTGERGMEQATNSDGDDVAERRCTRCTLQTR